MHFYLQSDLTSYFSTTQSLFDQLMVLRGECFRHQKGRLTQRVLLGDRAYFIKQHRGVGWKEIFKNILQGRWPVLGAKNEWRALEQLAAMGIAAPKVVGYGQRGINPAKQESFVLMEEVAPAESLEHLHPVSCLDKRRWIQRIADIARNMHAAGINHRDFYLCHFLNRSDNLYLIDLHRAGLRRRVPLRWQIKDLAALYFSSKHIELTSRDYYRFIKTYTQRQLKNELRTNISLWKKVRARGEQLYRQHQI